MDFTFTRSRYFRPSLKRVTMVESWSARSVNPPASVMAWMIRIRMLKYIYRYCFDQVISTKSSIFITINFLIFSFLPC